MMPGDMNEDGVSGYLLEEVASYERNDHGGQRLGKKHLRKLLKAILRGCLDGSSCTEQKPIEVLLLEVLPEADSRPAATPSTPKEVIVRSRAVLAPAHDGGLPLMADSAAMRAELAALKSAKDKQQAELQAELEGLTFAKDELERKVKSEILTCKGNSKNPVSDVQILLSRHHEALFSCLFHYKGEKLEKHVPEVDSDPDDDVDFAGGLALRRRVAVTETAKGFLDRARGRATAVADHYSVTVSEQREFEALQNEKHREHEARFRELEREISNATKRK
ncbi:unnamed protein product, partial [Ectocarpus sp. 12 AP-2014]